jgi:hypothetical protein
MSFRVVKILRKQIPVLIQAMKSNGRANTLVKKLERNNCKEELDVPNTGMYCVRAIITRGLCIYYPIFDVHFFVSMKVFSENYVLM